MGAYAAALEYASGREAIVVGKPARAFFDAAMTDLGVERAVMIGDDVEADVGGRDGGGPARSAGADRQVSRGRPVRAGDADRDRRLDRGRTRGCSPACLPS